LKLNKKIVPSDMMGHKPHLVKPVPEWTPLR